MSFPDDPLDPEECPVDRVRILTGDIDSCAVDLVEDLYIYFLDVNEQNEEKAAIQALKALVAKYAKAVDEVLGDEEAKFSQRFEGYKELLNLYLKDPAFGLLGVVTPYAGGLSYSEKRSDALTSDLRGSPISVGSASSRSILGYRAGYYKPCDFFEL